jgi:hypothetical protein
LLKKTVTLKSRLLTLDRAPLICIKCAIDWDAKLASRVSHTSWDVVDSITITITLFVREQMIEERID